MASYQEGEIESRVYQKSRRVWPVYQKSWRVWKVARACSRRAVQCSRNQQVKTIPTAKSANDWLPKSKCSQPKTQVRTHW